MDATDTSFNALANIYDRVLDTWKCRYGLRRWRMYLRRCRFHKASLYRARELVNYRRVMLPAKIEYLYQEIFKSWALSCRYKKRLKQRAFLSFKQVATLKKMVRAFRRLNMYPAFHSWRRKSKWGLVIPCDNFIKTRRGYIRWRASHTGLRIARRARKVADRHSIDTYMELWRQYSMKCFNNKEDYTQADTIFLKFGGRRAFHRLNSFALNMSRRRCLNAAADLCFQIIQYQRVMTRLKSLISDEERGREAKRGWVHVLRLYFSRMRRTTQVLAVNRNRLHRGTRMCMRLALRRLIYNVHRKSSDRINARIAWSRWLDSSLQRLRRPVLMKERRRRQKEFVETYMQESKCHEAIRALWLHRKERQARRRRARIITGNRMFCQWYMWMRQVVQEFRPALLFADRHWALARKMAAIKVWNKLVARRKQRRRSSTHKRLNIGHVP